MELQVLVSHHVGSGSRTQASGRAASAQSPLQQSPKHLTNYVTAFFSLIFLKPGSDYYEAQGGLDHEILLLPILGLGYRLHLDYMFPLPNEKL